LLCGCAALALAAMPANRGPVQAASRQVVALSGPRVSAVDQTRTVVTFEAKGDIRGLLTLTLAPDSSPLTGELALVSRYVVDTLGGPEDEMPSGDGDEVDHEERPAFMERGSLRGVVTGGTLRYDGSGQLAAIEGLQVRIAGGNLEFKDATGSGAASAYNIQDVAAGTGTLVLAMEVK
jgi:hypothetical protein